MPRENKSQYAILGLLSKHELSGYEMKEKINKISYFHWSESNAQLYPLLKELESQKLVKSYIDLSSGARKKRIYQITPEGLAHLIEWLKKPAVRSHYREEMLLKVALGQHLPKTTLLSHLENYKQQLKEQQQLLAEMTTHINQYHNNRKDYSYLHLTYDYAETILEAKLKWVEHAFTQLAKKDKMG